MATPYPAEGLLLLDFLGSDEFQPRDIVLQPPLIQSFEPWNFIVFHSHYQLWERKRGTAVSKTEPGQLDMFNSDEMDMNDFPYAEEAGCKETLDPAHVDLVTQPGASRKYLNSSAEES